MKSNPLKAIANGYWMQYPSVYYFKIQSHKRFHHIWSKLSSLHLSSCPNYVKFL